MANKKNGGVIPAVSDNRKLWVAVGCQKCMECRKKKARDWQVRLIEDVRHNKNGVMITLTFSNESIKELGELTEGLEGYDRDNEIAKKAMRRFLERWRKEFKKSVRHWFVTELGHEGTENIHMHGILWTDKDRTTIERIWKYGFIWYGKNNVSRGFVNEQTVNYIVKYVNKMDEDHKEYEARVLTSAGIGAGYVTRVEAKKHKYRKGQTYETYRNRQGYEMGMPIYLRNKLFTEDEREEMWMEKLDKEERFVNGQRIDVSTEDGEERYYKILYEARGRNKRLGYGDDSINWDRKRYEREKRNMLYKKRIDNARNVKSSTKIQG